MRRRLNESIEKTRVASKAGRYEKLPEGKNTSANNLLEKGVNLSVETTPGTNERKL